ICMGIEMVAAHICKIHHVSICYSMFGCDQRFTDLQILKVLPERMNLFLYLFGAILVLLQDVSYSGRGALNGRALQIVKYPAPATHFFTSAGPSGASMHKLWHGRAMTG